MNKPVTLKTMPKHYLPAFGVLFVSLWALFMVWQELNLRYQQRMFDYFVFETQRISVRIEDSMKIHEHTLRSGAGFFAGSKQVDRKEWHDFVEMLELDRRYRGIQGLGYAQRIEADQLENHQLAVRRQGFPDYIVKPTGNRAFYTSIVFLEPFTGRNLRAFGFDMFTEPTRRAAMEYARDTGEIGHSGKVRLVQETETDVQAGMLAYLPIYRNGLMPQTVEQRRSALTGWVYIPYRMNDLINGILGNSLQTIRLEIFDGNNIRPETRLFDSQTADTPPYLQAQPEAVQRLQTLHLGGHRWTLRYTALPPFGKSTQFEPPWVELLAITLISVLLFIITWAYLNARRITNKTLQLAESLRQSERRFRSLFDNSPTAYLALTADGRIIDVNPKLCALLDYSDDELLDTALQDLICSADTDIEMLLKTFKTHHFLQTELTFLTRSGERITVIMNGQTQKNKQQTLTIHCILTNITERKQAENRLQLAARVFSDAHEGISITDAHGVIIEVNPTFCAITGYSREDVIGKNHTILHSARHSPAFYQSMRQRLLSAGTWQGEVWSHRKNGEDFVELLTISAMRDDQRRIVNYVGLFSDITETKLQQQSLERLAHYDPLTQLPNRTLFTDRFHQAIAHCKRDNSLLAIVYMDLDGFKQVNDNLGHKAGDNLLVEVAARIKSNLREEDTVSRMGGDEFTLLLVNLESTEQCEQALQRIHQSICEPYRIGDNKVSIGVSSGVTLYPMDNSNADYLLRHADAAMYCAKEQGRNRYYFFRPENTDTA